MTFQKRFSLTAQRFSNAIAMPPKEFFAVQITLTGEESGVFYIANTPHGFEVAPYDYRDHTAAMQISGDDLVKLLSGRLRPDRACACGRILVTGSLDHIHLLQKIADPPVVRSRK